MRYCDEYCINVPDDFPIDELTCFMAAARRILLQPQKGSEWQEFAGASNLIGWRFRAAGEEWENYKRSWNELGVAVPHEGIYVREKALFNMFSAGVSCMDSTAYALAALASHPSVLALPFGAKEQRACSLNRLNDWLAQKRLPLVWQQHYGQSVLRTNGSCGETSATGCRTDQICRASSMPQ